MAKSTTGSISGRTESYVFLKAIVKQGFFFSYVQIVTFVSYILQQWDIFSRVKINIPSVPPVRVLHCTAERKADVQCVVQVRNVKVDSTYLSISCTIAQISNWSLSNYLKGIELNRNANMK